MSVAGHLEIIASVAATCRMQSPHLCAHLIFTLCTTTRVEVFFYNIRRRSFFLHFYMYIVDVVRPFLSLMCPHFNPLCVRKVFCQRCDADVPHTLFGQHSLFTWPIYSYNFTFCGDEYRLQSNEKLGLLLQIKKK